MGEAMMVLVVVILNVVVAVINGGGNVHNGRGKVGGRDRQDGDVSVGTSSVSTVAAAF